jgi:hypothetical protein
MSDEKARQLVATPIVSVILQRLQSSVPYAPAIGDIFQAPFNGNGSPSVEMKTGDVFAIKFSTSLPGKVRLLSTDVNGVLTESDPYDVFPGEDNRMPRVGQQGIRMTGSIGIEVMDIKFFPCISAVQTIRDRASVRPFVNLLPSCGSSEQIGQGQSLRPSVSDQRNGRFFSKAMEFPANNDPGQVVGIDPNYTFGSVLSLRISVNHIAP